MFAKSAGNPLFARDLVLRLYEAAALEGVAGHGAAEADASGGGFRVIRLLGSSSSSSAGADGGELVNKIVAALPSSIEGLVRARYDRLDAAGKEVLKTAAVVGVAGVMLSSRLLERVADVGTADDFAAALRTCASRRFLEQQHSHSRATSAHGGLRGAGSGGDRGGILSRLGGRQASADGEEGGDYDSFDEGDYEGLTTPSAGGAIETAKGWFRKLRAGGRQPEVAVASAEDVRRQMAAAMADTDLTLGAGSSALAAAAGTSANMGAGHDDEDDSVGGSSFRAPAGAGAHWAAGAGYCCSCCSPAAAAADALAVQAVLADTFLTAYSPSAHPICICSGLLLLWCV